MNVLLGLYIQPFSCNPCCLKPLQLMDSPRLSICDPCSPCSCCFLTLSTLNLTYNDYWVHGIYFKVLFKIETENNDVLNLNDRIKR